MENTANRTLNENVLPQSHGMLEIAWMDDLDGWRKITALSYARSYFDYIATTYNTVEVSEIYYLNELLNPPDPNIPQVDILYPKWIMDGFVFTTINSYDYLNMRDDVFNDLFILLLYQYRLSQKIDIVRENTIQIQIRTSNDNKEEFLDKSDNTQIRMIVTLENILIAVSDVIKRAIEEYSGAQFPQTLASTRPQSLFSLQ